jgi:hypothetical protein
MKILITTIIFWVTFSCYSQTLYINGGFTNFSTNSLYIDGNLELGNNANYTNQGNVYLRGNLTNAGDMNPSIGTTYLDGAALQTLTNTAGDTIIFNNLVVDNPNNINTSASQTKVYGALTFTEGQIIQDTTQPFYFDVSASHTGANDTRHITGRVSKIGNTAFVFPHGNGTRYIPTAISAPSSASSIFTSNFVPVDPNVYGINLGTGVQAISSLEYFKITRDAGTDNVTVGLAVNYNATVGTATDLLVAYYNTSTAEWQSQGNNGVRIFNTNDTLVDAFTANTNFGFFTLASSNINTTPLPVTWLGFDVAPLSNRWALVEWATATEINTRHFEVLRSFNGQTWEIINITNAAGNSSLPINYTFIDKNIPSSVNMVYYKINQVDLDGKSEETNVKFVRFTNEFSNQNDLDIQVFPNPTQTYSILSVSDDYIGENYSIIDMNGKLIKHGTINNPKTYLDLSEWRSGVYFLKINNKNLIQNLKIVKTK